MVMQFKHFRFVALSTNPNFKPHYQILNTSGKQIGRLFYHADALRYTAEFSVPSCLSLEQLDEVSGVVRRLEDHPVLV